jgi:hypothetical protein
VVCLLNAIVKNIVFIICAWIGSKVYADGYGFDVSLPPANYYSILEHSQLCSDQGTWMRVRGVVDHYRIQESETRTVEADRAGLRALRERGILAAVLLRWEPASWKGGARPGGGHRMPVDLRDAYERGRWLGEHYGDVVEAWEIDNEPDIGYGPDNPESYVAFLKAVYLGLHAGAAHGERQEARDDRRNELIAERLELRANSSGWLARKRGLPSLNLKRLPSTDERREPLVIMAPLALPPGPYLERMWANGLASYTDGFNFHYYGYEEDFTGVYAQFRDAVAKLQAESLELRAESYSEPGARSSVLNAVSSKLIARKSWPIFVTEYGYGLLSAEARDTVAGRVDQWRWFSRVIKQVHDLRIAAPMAFYWNPYYEANLNEFGLTTEKPMRFVGGERPEAKCEGLPARSQNSDVSGQRETEANSAQLTAHSSFKPADFGEEQAQPWMALIGKKVGQWYASPALAYLWDYAQRNPYRSRGWTVSAALPSPVVIDFIPGPDLTQIKSSGGYAATRVARIVDVSRLSEAAGGWKGPASRVESPEGDGRRVGARGPVLKNECEGSGTLVVYNFADTEMVGRLVVSGSGASISGLPAAPMVLAPQGRVELPVSLTVKAEAYVAGAVRVRFVPDAPKVSESVFTTRLLPATEGMKAQRLERFDFSEADSSVNREGLQKRPLASQEPSDLKPNGRWLVTAGVRVEEIGPLWRFYIDHFPSAPLHAARVELPLPAGFSVPKGSLIQFEQRSVAIGSQGGTQESKPQGAMWMNIRMKNGNLFQTWPRQWSVTDWHTYAEQADNFTMGFFGRAALPWRFYENEPVSLVFFFSPRSLPAIYEVMDLRIVTVGQ